VVFKLESFVAWFVKFFECLFAHVLHICGPIICYCCWNEVWN